MLSINQYSPYQTLPCAEVIQFVPVHICDICAMKKLSNSTFLRMESLLKAIHDSGLSVLQR